MKKTLSICLVAVLVLAMAFSAVGCGAKEENNVFLGTWSSADLYYNDWGGGHVDVVTSITVQADGTAIISGSYSSGSDFSDYEESYTWELEKEKDGEQKLIISPEGADSITDCYVMVYKDGQMYVKSRITNDLFAFEKAE